MNTLQPLLPAYTSAMLSSLDIDGLLELLARDEDRVPRNAIDACAQRGDAMVPPLNGVLDDFAWYTGGTTGAWWRLLHAVMILGLIPTEAAGLQLVKFMRRMSERDDDNLQDWLAGHWPVFFSNKPVSLLPALRALCDDRNLDCYMRANAVETMIAMAQRSGPAVLEDTLHIIATVVGDETEDWDYRLYTANTLIDFPRPQYRELLETLANRQQQPFGKVFLKSDIEKSYAAGTDNPNWQRRPKTPWHFYEPQAIAARQERWAQEDREADEREARGEIETVDYDHGYTEPFVRDTPKTGRNDPCPCGSGKKYKKCCLNSNAPG